AVARDRRIPARAGEARSQAGLGGAPSLGGAGRAAGGGGETMMSRSGRPGGFDEMEALIYRLFAEKQFALALLALVMVAQLLSAQFLLLRLTPPSQQARAQVIDAARPAEPKKAERRIRIVQLPRPRVDRPLPQPAAARPPAPSPAAAAPRPQPSPAPPLARIAADSTAMHGVRMRVLVPRSPGKLASHLRNSGGCLVISRLAGGSAEVLSVLALD